MLLIDGKAVTSFVSVHVPPNQLELFDGMIQTFALLKWLISEHEVKLVPKRHTWTKFYTGHTPVLSCG
jgi:hypothetical protein